MDRCGLLPLNSKIKDKDSSEIKHFDWNTAY